MIFPHSIKERGLGGHLAGGQGGRSITSRAWLGCREILFMKRVAIAQRTLHRSIRHQRWDSDISPSAPSAHTPVHNFSRDFEENADYEKLTRAEVLKLWQDINDMSVAADLNRADLTHSQDTASSTPGRTSAFAAAHLTPWRRIISKFHYLENRSLRITRLGSRLVQMTFRERLRSWLNIQDTPRRWPQGLRLGYSKCRDRHELHCGQIYEESLLGTSVTCLETLKNKFDFAGRGGSGNSG